MVVAAGPVHDTAQLVTVKQLANHIVTAMIENSSLQAVIDRTGEYN